jgi:hypothetical protein
MPDYVLKFQVWAGVRNPTDLKLASFRDVEHATKFLLAVKYMYPNSYIYNELTHGYIGKD